MGAVNVLIAVGVAADDCATAAAIVDGVVATPSAARVVPLAPVGDSSAAAHSDENKRRLHSFHARQRA